MTVDVIEPHGFCMGVRRAIERAVSLKPPVYCLHELVHNEHVSADLRARGVRVVESLDGISEPGARVLFSAHGVPPAVRDAAAARGFRVEDATCPFVARAHAAARAFAGRGVPVVVVGHAEHVEVRGLAGEAPGCCVVISESDVAALPFPADGPVGVVCQTTLAGGTVARVLAALRARYPRLETPPAADTCTATRDRQRAVTEYVRAHPGAGVLVLGSAASSNTLRLVETARAAGAPFAARAGTCDEARAVLASCTLPRLGLTSGASTPETVLRSVLELLQRRPVEANML